MYCRPPYGILYLRTAPWVQVDSSIPPGRLSASTSQHTTVVLTSGPQVFGPSESHNVVLFLLNRHHSASGEMMTDRVAAQSARSRAFIVVDTQLHKNTVWPTRSCSSSLAYRRSSCPTREWFRGCALTALKTLLFPRANRHVYVGTRESLCNCLCTARQCSMSNLCHDAQGIHRYALIAGIVYRRNINDAGSVLHGDRRDKTQKASSPVCAHCTHQASALTAAISSRNTRCGSACTIKIDVVCRKTVLAGVRSVYSGIYTPPPCVLSSHLAVWCVEGIVV